MSVKSEEIDRLNEKITDRDNKINELRKRLNETANAENSIQQLNIRLRRKRVKELEEKENQVNADQEEFVMS